jgi:8-oxo-dGTP pyrophosphatase MutT (NUDIX family)
MLAPALPAASIIVLRDDPFEVLMLRRHGKSSFVPNAWVFPGGAVEPGDADARAAGVRETFEETGLRLDPEALVLTSRWITPEGLPKRFDTYFFLAAVSRDLVVTIDEREIVDAMWVAPSAALARRDLHLVFPTIRNLEAIASFDNTRELIDSRRGATIEPVMPVLVNGTPVLP